ncbi:uncharacterized protein [Argopecten irradians]|uniref:uncharacterized protein n=1 Tax=Argopecten irradians TaxID=31199 RepID=UPI003713D3A9
MAIETFLNIFLCYSSLQCNRIPYFSPKHFIESAVVGGNKQYVFKRCNETAELPKVYLNDVCRCIPEKYYSNFMFIKDGIRRGQYNGFKMNCSQVYNMTNDVMLQNAGSQFTTPSKISTDVANLLRSRGVSPLEIARIQATGLTEAQLEQLQARRKLTAAEVRFMQSRGVPLNAINAMQVRGLLPSEIRALRNSGRLPSVSNSRAGMPSGAFHGTVTPARTPGGLPVVTPIRPLQRVIPSGIGRRIVSPIVRRPPVRGGLPVVTPIGPVGVRPPTNVRPTSNVGRITKFQELQLLSRQANPLQLIERVRSLNIQDLVSVAMEMSEDQFIAMWKILTDAQKQQLYPRLTQNIRSRLNTTQTHQESLQAFQNLLTPRQIMQLTPAQLSRLGAVLANMGGDNAQLANLLTSSGATDTDSTGKDGIPFTKPDDSPVTGIMPNSAGNRLVDTEVPTEPATGPLLNAGSEGSVPSTGTGMLTPVNKDNGAETMILYDVVTADAGDSQINNGNVVEVGITPIDTSGNVVVDTGNVVVDTGNAVNVPGPPAPDSQLTSGSLVVDNPVISSAFASSASSTITETSSGSVSTNTVSTGGTQYNSEPSVTIGNEYNAGTSNNVGDNTNTNVINPNYEILEGTGDLPADACIECEQTARLSACYLPHPTNCNRFIQCVTDSPTKLRPQEMRCYPYTYWDQDNRICSGDKSVCKTPANMDNLPKEPVVEAPVVYGVTPTEPPTPTPTTTPLTTMPTDPPPGYAPFKRVHATVEMSLYPEPPSGPGLVLPDSAPSKLGFPDIHTGLSS